MKKYNKHQIVISMLNVNLHNGTEIEYAAEVCSSPRIVEISKEIGEIGIHDHCAVPKLMDEAIAIAMAELKELHKDHPRLSTNIKYYVPANIVSRYVILDNIQDAMRHPYKYNVGVSNKLILALANTKHLCNKNFFFDIYGMVTKMDEKKWKAFQGQWIGVLMAWKGLMGLKDKDPIETYLELVHNLGDGAISLLKKLDG